MLKDKILTWYTGLPWWGKILGFVVLVLIGVLVVLKWVLPEKSPDRTVSDRVHDDGFETIKDDYADQAKVLETLVKNKKRELATHLNQAGAIDNDTLKAREKIVKAKTMEELLALQKELGL
jgi:hypothetical protein